MGESKRRVVVTNTNALLLLFCLQLHFKSGSPADSLLPASTPSIISPAQSYRVPVGQTAELACEVEGLGDSTQLWKNGTRVMFVGSLQIRSDPRVSRSKEKLIIKGVTVQDTGPYTCEVEADREDQIAVHHFLQVLEAPVILASGPQAVTVRAGTTVSLSCRPRGHPPPSLVWSRMGEQHRSLSLGTSPVLTIEEAQRQDGGVYQCTADNGVGSPVTRKISLRVLYPPEVVAVQSPVHASLGWGVNISCDVWWDPPGKLTWLKGKAEVAPGSVFHTMAETMMGALRHSISLVPQQPEDITNFTCIARNKMGSGKASILLTGLPSSPLVSSGELSSSRDSYLLAWHTTSFTDILQYQVLYRRLPSGSIVYAWDSINLEGEAVNQVRDASGQTVLQQYKVEHLSPDSAFVAKIKARNSVGWSGFSKEFLFYTQGKDSPPVESHVLTSSAPQGARGDLHHHLVLLLLLGGHLDLLLLLLPRAQ